jgi:hypothetical protein
MNSILRLGFLLLSSCSPARASNFLFEHCDPVAQLNGFRVHGGGKVGKAREHCTFVCIEIGAGGMRAIERQCEAADGIGYRHGEHRPPETRRKSIRWLVREE